MINKHLYIFLLLAGSIFVQSKAQQQAVVIEGATIHLGNGQVIGRGVIGFDSGRIVFVDSVNRSSYKHAQVINATGKHIYPGLILLNTYLGLNEIDAVRSTRDYQETGDLNPNVRSLIAYNTDSRVVPTATFNGIAYMQVVPQGGLVSGTSCVVKTEAMNWEDALVKEDGVHINWPEAYGRYLPRQEKRITDQKEKLNRLFDDASVYPQNPLPKDRNLKLEALQGLFSGDKRVFVHVSSAKAILEALNFIKRYPALKAVLVTGTEASRVTDEIRQSGVPVIVNLVHSLPLYNHSDVDLPYKTAAMLTRAGIITALGFSGSWESRNVPFTAGTCAIYGLSREDALKLVTGNAALIAGADSIGTLEAGKKATLVITGGDLLDMKSSRPEILFIDGMEIPLINSQTELYNKYLKRYGLE